MKQHTIYFIAGEKLILDETAYQSFLRAIFEQLSGEELRSFKVGDSEYIINRGNITHVISEDIQSDSNVITPPTPAQLKSEKEQEELNRDVSLDAQLENAGE